MSDKRNDTQSLSPQDQLAAKNKRMLTITLAIAIGMVGFSFAFVPLYNLFCKMTGYGGTTQVAEKAPDTVLDRTVTVRFNADVNRNLPWSFKPETHSLTVKLGEQKLIAYHAKNNGKQDVTGTAIYNVTPPEAGKYFHKIQCFCFQEQVLNPGKDMTMPVVFYVDPSLNDNPALKDLKVITLSYTFFQSESDAYDKAMEEFTESNTP
jgi:cytochrome c oxidase assembly protein subunit 11